MKLLRGTKRELDVLFVTTKKHRRAASVSLRVDQLRALLGIARPGLRIGVQELPLSRFERIVQPSARVVVITKYSLPKIGLQEAERLAQRSAIVLDPIDGPVPDHWMHLADGVLSPSIDAASDLQHLAPRAAVHHVPHHIDLRIPEVSTQQNSFRAAFFGELGNALHLEHLQGVIEPVPTRTGDDRDRSWQTRLEEFPVHYAVRPQVTKRLWKPPTKLAIAAHVGANIITVRSEPDVECYLGADYPYLAATSALEAVLEAVERARSGFGTAEWEEALNVMRHVRKSFTAHAVCEALGRAFDDILSGQRGTSPR